MINLSIVIPVYGCSSCISELFRRVSEALRGISGSFEVILVDDGSTDGGWEEIVKLAGRYKTVKGIKLSRNFGQHIAISAGLNICKGKYVVVMDCDLQDKPEEINKLYKKITSDKLDIVFARRKSRNDPFSKKSGSIIYHKLFTLLSGTSSDPAIANFSIISRRAIDAFNSYPEKHRSYLQIVKGMGFKQGTVDVNHGKRFAGPTSYNLTKLVTLAVDTATGTSTRLLTLWMAAGFTLSFISFITGMVIGILYLIGEFTVPGWTSIIVMVTFLSGMILFGLGVVALYLGKLFEEVKGRPLYIIQDKVNF